MSSLGPTDRAPWDRRLEVVVVERLPDGTVDWEGIAKDLGRHRDYIRWQRQQGRQIVKVILKSDATRRVPRRRAPRRSVRRVARAGPGADADPAPAPSITIMGSTKPGRRGGAERTDTRLSDADVQRIARAVAPIVMAQLVTALGAVGTATYSTREGCAPDGYSRDAWRALARRIGVRRGRYWYVSQSQLDAHERRRDEHDHHDQQAPANDADAWTPADSAAAAGHRGNGGRS